MQTEKAVKDSASTFDRQIRDLKSVQAEADRIKADRKALDELLQNMPAEGVGKLHWKLSQKLFELTKKHEVRLISVKYGPPPGKAPRAAPWSPWTWNSMPRAST